MNKETFKKEAKQSIDSIFNKIDELAAKKEEASEDLKKSYNEKISTLETKKNELQNKYNELENASEDKWEEVKASYNDALSSFKEGFTELASLFK